jgi:hypothetical protein
VLSLQGGLGRHIVRGDGKVIDPDGIGERDRAGHEFVAVAHLVEAQPETNSSTAIPEVKSLLNIMVCSPIADCSPAGTRRADAIG